MKRCQIGVGPRQMGRVAITRVLRHPGPGNEDEIEQLRAALLDARDYRTCRNFTTRSGGCVSVLRCVDGKQPDQRQRALPDFQAAPLDAPF